MEDIESEVSIYIMPTTRLFEEILDTFISGISKEAIELSDYLANNPELSEQEFNSSKLFAEKLNSYGFDVEYPFLALPTAFMAKKIRKPGAVVTFLVEYDALPGIGHACGHNLHGSMAAYAGIALSKLLDEIGGEVWVVGTPAEETDGAKCKMADAGVFDKADLALMFHSSGGCSFTDARALALEGYEFVFKGKSSHASANPWLGRSAQNGARLFLDALDMLRLHCKDGSRIHGLLTQVSGAINIIPETAVCRVEVRATTRSELNQMLENVFCCAEGAAIATKTEVVTERFMSSFDDILPNNTAEKMSREILKKLGVKCVDGPGAQGSTDVGNVSYRCPAIQPEFAITEKPLAIHTREFAEATKTEEAHRALITGIRAMSRIGLRVLADEKTRVKIKTEYLNRIMRENTE